MSASSSSYGETNQSISNIDAIIDEAIASRIDIEQRENATIQATALKLEEGLKQLSNLINNKSSPIEVMMIGHTQVHPNLQAAFNLQLRMKI